MEIPEQPAHENQISQKSSKPPACRAEPVCQPEQIIIKEQNQENNAKVKRQCQPVQRLTAGQLTTRDQRKGKLPVGIVNRNSIGYRGYRDTE